MSTEPFFLNFNDIFAPKKTLGICLTVLRGFELSFAEENLRFSLKVNPNRNSEPIFGAPG